MGFPRARGDVPAFVGSTRSLDGFSPRTRGCSQAAHKHQGFFTVFPAHAGMFLSLRQREFICEGFPRARGDVPIREHSFSRKRSFSPRTRGCSLIRRTARTLIGVFPAHAGMFPGRQLMLNLMLSFPRARGDVPVSESVSTNNSLFSPRTRGCSELWGVQRGSSVVFPAHAGMFLWPTSR